MRSETVSSFLSFMPRRSHALWLKIVRSINVIHFILDSASFGSFQIFSYILWGDEVSYIKSLPIDRNRRHISIFLLMRCLNYCTDLYMLVCTHCWELMKSLGESLQLLTGSYSWWSWSWSKPLWHSERIWPHPYFFVFVWVLLELTEQLPSK